MVEFFKRWLPKEQPPRLAYRNRYDGKTAERGYDGPWQRLSKEFLRENPFCMECERRGKLEMAIHCDHMIPIADRPELRLEWDNLQGLCGFCHNSWKRRMEAYARKAHKIDDLADWCKNPKLRPKHFR